jgi:hypothetical protein
VGSGGESPLELLGLAAGREFRFLLRAREVTAKGLAEKGEQLSGLAHDPDASIVLMGSWGRAEVTAGSDHDFMALVDGPERQPVTPSVEEVKVILDQAHGDQGTFGERVFCDRLVHNIGLDRDDNKNLTRRMLFLLESAPVTAEGV